MNTCKRICAVILLALGLNITPQSSVRADGQDIVGNVAKLIVASSVSWYFGEKYIAKCSSNRIHTGSSAVSSASGGHSSGLNASARSVQGISTIKKLLIRIMTIGGPMIFSAICHNWGNLSTVGSDIDSKIEFFDSTWESIIEPVLKKIVVLPIASVVTILKASVYRM